MLHFRTVCGVSGLLGLLCAVTAAPGCTEDDGNPTVAPSAGAAAVTGGTGGSPALPSGGSTIIIGGDLSQEPAGGDGGAAGGEQGSVSPGDACATSTAEVTALPSILQLVIDTSGSMDWPPGWMPASPDDSKPPGATKWEITRDALLGAVAALPDDVALGVNFYPNVEQEGDTCLLNREAAPIRVLGAKSSSARKAFATAMNKVVPVGATPTHGAYRFGLVQLTQTTLTGNKFVLLITDGTPTCTIDCMCTENNEPVDTQPLLDEAAARKDGISTFVIGSPGSEDARQVLSELASVGGTAKSKCSDAGPTYCHFDMTTEPDLATGLAEALDQIGMRLRSCEYPIPAPPAGQTLDPGLVNVLYTPAGGTTETVGRDPVSGKCDEGWQYSADGSSIVLCGSACDRVQTDPASSVEILFGCETVTSKPK